MKQVFWGVEIVVLYAALVFINHFFFPDLPVWIGVDPHPYWLGIFLFGYRYGLGAGFFAALLASGLYLGLSWYNIDHYLFEDTAFYVLPTLFIIVGVLTGLSSQRLNKKWHAVINQETVMNDHIKNLEKEVNIYKEVNQGLEKRIVSRMSTLVTLYEGARKLESVYIEDLYQAIVEFIAKTLDAGEISIFLKKGDVWYLKSSYGFNEYQKINKIIGYEEGMIGAAGTSGRVVSVRDYLSKNDKLDAPQIIGDCLFAGPLKRGEKGDVLGVVAVNKISFLNFNSSTLNLFHFLLTWASRAIDRALIFEEMRENEILDPDYKIYSYKYFQSRFNQEFLRSKTYYLPLSLVLVQIPGLVNIPSLQKRAYLTVLSHYLKKNCRETDVLTCYHETEIPFAILMVTTSEKQMGEELVKLKKNYENFDWPLIANGKSPQINFKIASFTPQDITVDDMISKIQ
ncbi:MAG: diguanylate cyclase with GAF sensor [uncultured bacterium]|nr:MAG: diguanylate cyclase with GAF sensor [uncultured bacterium]